MRENVELFKSKDKVKKRDWSKVKRTCNVCNKKYTQGQMNRFEYGWICEECEFEDNILNDTGWDG